MLDVGDVCALLYCTSSGAADGEVRLVTTSRISPEIPLVGRLPWISLGEPQSRSGSGWPSGKWVVAPKAADAWSVLRRIGCRKN